MVINSYENTVTEIKTLNATSSFFSANAPNPQLQVKKRGDVVATAPKDHLRALQQDLIKRGYRKVR